MVFACGFPLGKPRKDFLPEGDVIRFVFFKDSSSPGWATN